MSKSLIHSFLIAVLIVLSFSSSVHAWRTVGNGGGLSEMRVVYLFQNLDRFLKVCLNVDNSCQLPTSTFTEWQNILTKFRQPQLNYQISFVNKNINEKDYFVEGRDLKISHQALYADLNTPNKAYELLAFVISINQELIGTGQSFKENLQIAKQAFKDLKIEEYNHKVLSLPSLLRLNQLKIFDGLSNHLIIGIEDEKKTIDLSEAIKSALPCGHFSNWNFTQWSSSTISKTVYFYGFAFATCESKSVKKRIVIKAEFDDKFLINAQSLQVNFFSND